ncbi:FAD-dependent oxidoreductase [Fodinicola acaciae]|uniref:FAD-dependent oxidoreductase n=1 Tax=Fodinicola acaciae TaxID=2681555 RepID=UPI0013D2A72D|nr:FAD-dependent monooxygenase [Fodinicola acaciae]
MKPLHVVVIGGGIGGLCLAQGLKQAGVSVAVYERDRTPDSRTQGYRINVNSTGAVALHDCLPPALWRVLVATAGDAGRGIGFLDEKMRELVLLGNDGPAADPDDPLNTEHAVSRITLRKILLAGLADLVHFDKEFLRYKENSDGTVTAYFADGSRATGDVLIGADGTRSRVREQLVPRATTTQIPAIGVAGKLMLTPETLAWLPEILLARKNVFWPKRDFLFTAVFRRREDPAQVAERLGDQLLALGLDPRELVEDSRDNDYILWALIGSSDTFPAGFTELTGPPILDVVGDRIRDWHPSLRRLVKDADQLRAVGFTAAAPVEAWPSRRVTVLGDAIHHMPPVGGLGGNTALWDANLLRRTLISVAAGEKELVAGIGAYEAAMREHGFATVRDAVRNTEQAATRNALSRLRTRLFFKACGAIPPLRRAALGYDQPVVDAEERLTPVG